MKKSEFKEVLTRILTAHDILEQCLTKNSLEDLKNFCNGDERLLFRLSLFDTSRQDDFIQARDFVVAGILENIIRDYATLK